MTVHFLTSDFERKSFLLAFRPLKERQTFDVLATEIQKVLNEFEIPKCKVTHIVTDGGSAFCKAFKKFGKQHDPLTDDIPQEEDDVTDDEENSQQTNEISSITLPFMQSEDGELFVSNEFTFTSDPLVKDSSTANDSVENMQN